MVLFHEQAEVVVLGLKPGVFVSEHHFLNIGVHFLLDELVLWAGEVLDVAGVDPSNEVTDEVGLAVHAEQGQIHLTHAHSRQRSAVEEEVVDPSCCVLQGVQTFHVDGHAIILLQLAQERRFGDFGAAVASTFFDNSRRLSSRVGSVFLLSNLMRWKP